MKQFLPTDDLLFLLRPSIEPMRNRLASAASAQMVDASRVSGFHTVFMSGDTDDGKRQVREVLEALGWKVLGTAYFNIKVCARTITGAVVRVDGGMPYMG